MMPDTSIAAQMRALLVPPVAPVSPRPVELYETRVTVQCELPNGVLLTLEDLPLPAQPDYQVLVDDDELHYQVLVDDDELLQAIAGQCGQFPYPLADLLALCSAHGLDIIEVTQTSCVNAGDIKEWDVAYSYTHDVDGEPLDAGEDA